MVLDMMHSQHHFFRGVVQLRLGGKKEGIGYFAGKDI
jgi:hypothetical protein